MVFYFKHRTVFEYRRYETWYMFLLHVERISVSYHLFQGVEDDSNRIHIPGKVEKHEELMSEKSTMHIIMNRLEVYWDCAWASASCL